MEKSELDPALRDRLIAFKKKAMTSTVAKTWSDPKELPGMVAISLQRTTKVYPAVGRVPANQMVGSEILIELERLRRENQDLTDRINQGEGHPDQLASLEGVVDLCGEFHDGSNWRNWEFKLTWGDLFALVGPYIVPRPDNSTLKAKFNEAVLAEYVSNGKLKDVASEFEMISFICFSHR